MSYDPAGNRKLLAITNGTWADTLVFGNDSIQYRWELLDFGGKLTEVHYTMDQLLDTLVYPTGTSTTHLRVHPSSYNHYLRLGVVDVYGGTEPPPL